MALSNGPLVEMSELANEVPIPVIQLVSFYRELGWTNCSTKQQVPRIMAEVTSDFLNGKFEHSRITKLPSFKAPVTPKYKTLIELGVDAQ